MLSLFRNVLLKLSETTPPPKLFPSDCITLYYKTLVHPVVKACSCIYINKGRVKYIP